MIGINLSLCPGIPRTSALNLPPPGYVFLLDDDGAYLSDEDGNLLVEDIPPTKNA
ncbi:hypothetical protein [Neorhizobium lilium]|uniref:hypothetical protein n=1 Tax=Neorhizobium lilium TaxID=2503024 RepID=UPI0013E3957C|nr:hypothetical protein [Neorhizobium lilium]